jgi:hypothetical protein
MDLKKDDISDKEKYDYRLNILLEDQKEKATSLEK